MDFESKIAELQCENDKLKAEIDDMKEIIDILNKNCENIEEFKVREEQVYKVQKLVTQKCEEYQKRIKASERKYSKIAQDQSERDKELAAKEKRLSNLNKEANRRAQKIYSDKDKKLRRTNIVLTVICITLFITLMIFLSLFYL